MCSPIHRGRRRVGGLWVSAFCENRPLRHIGKRDHAHLRRPLARGSRTGGGSVGRGLSMRSRSGTTGLPRSLRGTPMNCIRDTVYGPARHSVGVRPRGGGWNSAAGGWCGPVADDSAAELEVGLREVVADRHEWLVAQRSGRIRHTVAKVERSAVAALAVLQVGPLCGGGVLLGEMRYAQVDFAAQSLEDGACDRAVAGGQNDQAFG